MHYLVTEFPCYTHAVQYCYLQTLFNKLYQFRILSTISA